jgi:hypothetical protein
MNTFKIFIIILLVVCISILIAMYVSRHYRKKNAKGLTAGRVNAVGGVDSIPKVCDIDRALKIIFGSYRSKELVTTLFNEIKKKQPVFETIDDLKHKLPYIVKANASKLGEHIGQRKLFLSELQFLTHNKAKYCVYAGSAPGNKTHYLSTLFPNIKFILVDPNKFDLRFTHKGKIVSHRNVKHKDIVHIKSGYPLTCNTVSLKQNEYSKHIKNAKRRIFIIEDYMSIPLSEELKKLGDTIFISDIRTRHPDQKFPIDFDIYWNNSMMLNWMSIMKPNMSMIKYRQPYLNDKTMFDFAKADFAYSKKLGIDFLDDFKKGIVRLPKSTIYLQAWAGQSSTEVRLWIAKKDLNNIVEYDSIDMEEKINYFNVITRMWSLHHNPNASRKIGFCNCNDCALENKIWTDYGYNKKQVHEAVTHLGKLLYRPLIRVHPYRYFTLFNNSDIIKRMNIRINYLNNTNHR